MLDTIALPPALALTTDSGNSSDKVTNISTLNLTGVETGATVQYSTDNGTTWSNTFTASEGANSVQVHQIDVAGNTSAASAKFDFTVDTTAPTLSSSTPADNATALSTDGNIDVVLTFSEKVMAGTGNIILSDGAGDVRTIPVGDAQVTINDKVVTINSTANLHFDTTYHVKVDNGAFTDVAGNTYTGISDTTTLNFTTKLVTNPVVTITTNDSLLKVGDAATVTFTLSEPSVNFAVGDITVSGGGTLSNFSGSGATYTATFTPDTNTAVTSSISVLANTFTNGTGLDNIASTPLSLTVDTIVPVAPSVALTTDSGSSSSDSITNIGTLHPSVETGATVEYSTNSGNTWSSSFTAMEGSNSVQVRQTDAVGNVSAASTNFSFTFDTTAPTLSASTPIDNAMFSPDGNIVLTFSENMAAGTGNIVISDGASDVRTIPAGSSQVTISGSDVTINPTDALHVGTAYYVQVDGNAFTDVAGNAYAGISDTTSLNFNTPTAPTISSTIDGVTSLDVTSNLVLTASEAVTAVAGKYIHVINDGGTGFHGEATINTQDILVTDTAQVTITNNTIIINPGFDLDFANDYHIMVDSGAFLGSTSGQGSVATADATVMNFSTVLPDAGSTAASSSMMTTTDAVSAGHSWWDAEGNGVPGGIATAKDFSGGDFAVTANDLATTGIATNDFYIAVNNFGVGDLIYVDNHGDNAVQRQSDFDSGLIIDFFGEAPTTVITSASGTSSGLNGGQFDVTLAGLTASFTDTAALKVLLNVTYEPIHYG
jgi:hypothetical protein